jgi:hypothetical protein
MPAWRKVSGMIATRRMMELAVEDNDQQMERSRASPSPTNPTVDLVARPSSGYGRHGTVMRSSERV